jgi:hypothetical protein
MPEKPGDALGEGHARRLFIILRLAREAQIAARPDMRSPLVARVAKLRQN